MANGDARPYRRAAPMTSFVFSIAFGAEPDRADGESTKEDRNMRGSANRILSHAVVVSFVLLGASAAKADTAGAVYVMSNSATGNSVFAFQRDANGELTQIGSFPTGGLGTGINLGTQSALAMSDSGRYLFAVNAGSGSFTVFAVIPPGLQRVAVVPSGGRNPVSVDARSRFVYVLNAGGAVGDVDRVDGFRIRQGRPVAIQGATMLLNAVSTGPAQVAFDPDGTHLVVTEKDTNLIDVIELDENARPVSLTSFPSSGATPFGFEFGVRDQLFVSEAFGGLPDASAVSSYVLEEDGALVVVDPSEETTETAACWVVVTRDGRFIYETNTGSGTVTGFAVSDEGELTLLDPDGVTGDTGTDSGPLDLDISVDGLFLYTLNGGNGTVSAFRIGSNGALTAIAAYSGVPIGATGLVAR
jgi:6-phosphogluconolactonase (cycloisomerase 2 family)